MTTTAPIAGSFTSRGTAGELPGRSRSSSAAPVGLGVLGLAALLLSACASYHPIPLPAGPDLASAPSLQVPVGQLHVPGLKPHPFNAANGLDMTEVVTLAVVNNPGLKAVRLKAGVAGAQLLQAGLLPDPQLSPSLVHPTGGPPPLSNGYSLGLSQDLAALVTRGAARAAARAHRQQVNLDVLWQEWQVAQQARQLFVRARSQSRLQNILDTQRRLLQDRYRRDQKALQEGNLTLSAVSADLVGLVDAQTRLRTLQRQRNKTWHGLDGLLGLQPGVEPRLTGSPDLTPFSRTAFAAAIRRLPERRPDLLALRYGYRSQEQAVREAILRQFPALSVGLTGGRDTSDVRSVGLGVTLTLPLFNRNRGNIAVARATRAVLRQTYQQRLDRAVNHAHELWQATRIMGRQLHTLQGQLPVLERTTAAAQRSFQQGNMSAGTYISLRSNLLAKRAEAVQLQASLQQAQAALETLLGMTLDTRHLSAPGGPS